jgi:putative ABC transport system ATP-binding protein
VTRRHAGAGIRLEALHKSYAGTEVLHGVDASVEPGSFTVLNGPSGSGKTTLLNLTAGLDLPDRGAVTVGGTCVTSLDPAARARFRAEVGLVFQRSGLLGGLTGRENIEVGHCLTRRPIDAPLLDELAARLAVTDVLDTPATKVSGGQAQRLALVRALVHRPSVLFADEPTASLDEASKTEVHELLRSVAHDRGVTVLMVSHDPGAPAYADATITLVDGRVVAPTAVEEVARAPVRGWRGLFG